MGSHVRVFARDKATWELFADPEILGITSAAAILDNDGETAIEPAHRGIDWGQGAVEFPLPDGADLEAHNYGRVYTEQYFTQWQLEQIAGLYNGQERVFSIVNPHGYDGPEWPFPEKEDLD